MYLIPMMYLIVSTLSPGPVTVVTAHNTARYGRSTGIAVALGGAATMALFAIAAAMLTAGSHMIQVPVDTANTTQQAGALFILAMGLMTGYHSLVGNHQKNQTTTQTNVNAKSFFSGLALMFPYFPQAILFYTIILPQYVAADNLVNIILLMGLLKVLLTVGWYTAVAYLAQPLQNWLFNPRLQRVVGFGIACFFIVTSVKLFTN